MTSLVNYDYVFTDELQTSSKKATLVAVGSSESLTLSNAVSFTYSDFEGGLPTQTSAGVEYDGSMVSRENNDNHFDETKASIAFWFYLDATAVLPQTLLSRHEGASKRIKTNVLLTIAEEDKLERNLSA